MYSLKYIQMFKRFATRLVTYRKMQWKVRYVCHANTKQSLTYNEDEKPDTVTTFSTIFSVNSIAVGQKRNYMSRCTTRQREPGSDINLFRAAVSYTHLDVYKRQIPSESTLILFYVFLSVGKQPRKYDFGQYLICCIKQRDAPIIFTYERITLFMY